MNISITNTLSWFPLLVQAMYTDSCCWHSRNCPLYYIKSPTAQRMSAWALTLMSSVKLGVTNVTHRHTACSIYFLCIHYECSYIYYKNYLWGNMNTIVSQSVCKFISQFLYIFRQLRKLRLSNACFWLIQQIKNLTNQCTLCFENTDAIAKYDNKKWNQF